MFYISLGQKMRRGELGTREKKSSINTATVQKIKQQPRGEVPDISLRQTREEGWKDGHCGANLSNSMKNQKFNNHITSSKIHTIAPGQQSLIY